MTISIIGTATVVVSAGNPIAAAVPTGAASKDMLAFFSTGYVGDGADGITPPAGYAFVAPGAIENQSESEEGDGTLTTWTAAIILAGEPPATLDLDVNPNDFQVAITTLCLRADPGYKLIIDSGAGAPTVNADTSGTITWLALTTSAADEMLIAWLFGDDSSLSTTPTGFTTQVNGYFNDAFQALFTMLQPSAGSTGSPTATYAFTDDWNATFLAVRQVPDETDNNVIFYSTNA